VAAAHLLRDPPDDRLAYGLFRFLVALVFGPVALILWAIPQTEWVTSLWLREFVGWGTTPILVVVALSMAIPLAIGQAAFWARCCLASPGCRQPTTWSVCWQLLAVGVASGELTAALRGPGGAGSGHWRRCRVAAASIPANRMTTLAEQYGYD